MTEQVVTLTRPAGRHAGRTLRVGLVNMPFASMTRPSIQIALLAGYVRRAGHVAETLHLNLEFAAMVEAELYSQLCEHRGDVFLGEWLFARAAFPDSPPATADVLERLDRLRQKPDDHEFRDRIVDLRERVVGEYLDAMSELEDWSSFDVVGFSSTFQQSTASFAMARRIKERAPNVATIFGGANFEGVMAAEYVRSAPMVDYAITGEADDSLGQFLAALAVGGDPATVPGVVTRRDGRVVSTETSAPKTDLDDQPELDYDEYFERAERLGLLLRTGRRLIDLPFESARGCWWGAKRHCTFCGLNGNTMSYRSKSPKRLLAELTGLVRRYRSFQLEAVDNIVETEYLTTLFPALEALETDLEIFYEVKADLSRMQLRRMSGAGVRRIQPGIESLSSHVLALMRKGTRACWNVNVLRWARYYGIRVSWNLLYGFPHETREDYEEQEQLIPHLAHLEPPTGPGRIWMERFSPIFTDRETFPAKRIEPAVGYRDVYPASFDLEQCAYFFDYELENTLGDDAFVGYHKTIADWQQAWRADKRPHLSVWRMPKFIQIDDRRSDDRAGTYTFEGPMADLYLSVMDKALRPSDVITKLGWSADHDHVQGLLDEFCDAGLMMRDRNLYLALALPASERSWR